jgi:TM2 domain-containing membrane protein YozV
MEKNKIEALFWSIALPGFAQFLNRKPLKGIVFITLEILINIMSNLNQVIILSFHGQIQEAIEQTNYNWMMFYPCLYLFVIFDAYKDAGGAKEKFSFVPFVLSAYFGTIGVIYSRDLLGPVWLPILFILFGFATGIIIGRVSSLFR